MILLSGNGHKFAEWGHADRLYDSRDFAPASRGEQYRFQLLHGWYARVAVRGEVPAAGKPDGVSCSREGVDAVDEDAWRTAKSDTFGFFDRVYDVSGHDHPGVSFNESREPLVGQFPIGAAVEVLQSDVHALTVNHEVRFKVKR